MPGYALFTRTRELPNGDLEITRFTDKPESKKLEPETVIVIPLYEREMVGKAVLKRIYMASDVPGDAVKASFDRKR